MPKVVNIDQGDLIQLMQEGLSQKEMAGEFNCSIPTVKSRIKELFQDEGLWTKYRDIQSIALTKLQFQILDSIDEETIQLAGLQERINAFRILKDKELVASGRPTEIKGLLGYLVKAEEKEKRIKAEAEFQEAEFEECGNQSTDGQKMTNSGKDINDPDYIPAI